MGSGPSRVDPALPGPWIQVLAGGVGIEDFSSILVLFIAAAPAPFTDRFPVGLLILVRFVCRILTHNAHLAIIFLAIEP